MSTSLYAMATQTSNHAYNTRHSQQSSSEGTEDSLNIQASSNAENTTNDPDAPPQTTQTTATLDAFTFTLFFEKALENPRITEKLKALFTTQGLAKVIAEEVKKVTEPLVEKIGVMEKKVKQLQDDLDAQEQYSRRESLRISGLRQEEGEDIEERVLQMFNRQMKVSPPIAPNDIARVHRVGSKNPKNATVPRQVLVKLSSYKVRAKVFKHKVNLTGSQLSINEDLTKQRAYVLYLARKAKHNGKLEDAWSFDGRINVRDSMKKIHRDVSEEKLKTLIGATTAEPTSSNFDN